MDDVREKVEECCFRLSMCETDDYTVTNCTDEIMALIYDLLDEERHYAAKEADLQ